MISHDTRFLREAEAFRRQAAAARVAGDTDEAAELEARAAECDAADATARLDRRLLTRALLDASGGALTDEERALYRRAGEAILARNRRTPR